MVRTERIPPIIEKSFNKMVRWTPEELTWLKENYSALPREQVYAHLLRHSISGIKGKANHLHLKSKKYWTQADLKYFRDNYGILPTSEICEHLGRTANALHIVSVRSLHICQKTNFYSAKAVANLFDVKCSKTVTAWKERGWLPGHRSVVNCGKNKVWFFTHKDIEDFVWSRPWMFWPEKMPHNEFRKIIKEEFARDPWFNLNQACSILKVKDYSSAMAGYIKKGWIHPVKVPIEGGNHWTYRFRKSDIDAFLANDPRVKSLQNKYRKRKLQHLQEGRVIEMCMVWQMLCPICKKSVLVRANPHIRGSEVGKLFIKTFCINGECSHKIGSNLNAVARPAKPYKILKSHGRKTIPTRHWPVSKKL